MGRKYIDLTGQKIGKWTVIERFFDASRSGSGKHVLWKCTCDCGTTKIVSSSNLRHKDRPKSCGCNRKNCRGVVKHGMSYSRLYGIWKNMKQRCYNLNLPAYRWWGGQGIEVCDEWKNDFTKFNDWALANGFKENLTFLTIDRIDPEKDYCPKNCQWIPHIENILKEHRDHENKRIARSQ